jgi:hypothetical protein
MSNAMEIQIMLNLLRKSAPDRLCIDPLRQAEVLLASFARANHGLFILDGPAIGTDPDRPKGTELDVYCRFEPHFMAQALAAAKNALAPLRHWQISYHRSDAFVGELLTYISRRARVLGERRSKKR